MAGPSTNTPFSFSPFWFMHLMARMLTGSWWINEHLIVIKRDRRRKYEIEFQRHVQEACRHQVSFGKEVRANGMEQEKLGNGNLKCSNVILPQHRKSHTYTDYPFSQNGLNKLFGAVSNICFLFWQNNQEGAYYSSKSSEDSPPNYSTRYSPS